jgi:hypothetical protein
VEPVVYARQGYRRENSPDAWAYLRQFDHRGTPIKNIERWPIQRDAPGSRKTATFQIPSLAARGSFPNDPTFLAGRDEPPRPTGNVVTNHDISSGSSKWHVPGEYKIVADPDRPQLANGLSP